MAFTDFLELAQCLFYGDKSTTNGLRIYNKDNPPNLNNIPSERRLFTDDPSIKEAVEKYEREQQSETLKVKITNNVVNASRIIEYKGRGVKKFSWYPENFEQFIGQVDAKEQAKIIIKKMDRGIKCHCILSAIQGHGKSTMIRLLAKEMGAKLIERVGKEIDEDSLIDVINEINTSKEEKVIFFLDEIDTTDWKILKLLNPVLQDFKMSGKNIKPFCFCCATINKDQLLKSVPDLLDRIPHPIPFTRYSVEELNTILKQYQKQLYPDVSFKEEIFTIIAQNSKFNPRLALGILEDFVVTLNIDKTLKSRRIIKDGLTEVDIKILETLNQSTKPMGSNALALRAGLNEKQYLREYEPFLYEFKYINRVPSRIISDKGRKFLKELTEVVEKYKLKKEIKNESL